MESVTRSRSQLLSTASRITIGFVLARYISSRGFGGEAASFNEPLTCTRDNLAQIFEQTKTDTETNSLATELLDICTDEFLRNNTINPSVKKTIDQWLGLDLSQATALQLLESYEKVLQERPDNNEDPEFVEGCKEMLSRYEEFRDTTSILADTVDGTAIVVNEDEAADSLNSQGAKTLLSYAQYGLFCSALIDN